MQLTVETSTRRISGISQATYLLIDSRLHLYSTYSRKPRLPIDKTDHVLCNVIAYRPLDLLRSERLAR
jgi:hypothetical protein